MDVSVIVPTLNEEGYISVCLKSIASQNTDLEYEIIVCDGGSEDRTTELAGEYAKVVESDARSVGLQRNLGADNSKGKYLLFVDADTILPPDYMDNAVKKFDENPELVGLSSSFRFSERNSRYVFTEKATNAYLMFRDRIGTPTLPGFNILLTREALDEVGGFKDVPLEDIDMSRRLARVGKTRYYTDFYVITSARRLEGLGLLGTLKYYLEMDLARMNPDLKRLLTYDEYVSCRIDSTALVDAFGEVSNPVTPAGRLNKPLRNYALDRLTALTDSMRDELDESEEWAKKMRKRLMEKVLVVSDSIAYLESKTIDSDIIDSALKQVEKKLRRNGNTMRKSEGILEAAPKQV
ncbi:MAG: glycosyltransferase [Candidatus Altiarchaeota archaeon]